MSDWCNTGSYYGSLTENSVIEKLSFLDLEECYLTPLKKLYFGKDFQFQYLVVNTLTSLLRNFVALEWPRHNKERGLMR